MAGHLDRTLKAAATPRVLTITVSDDLPIWGMTECLFGRQNPQTGGKPKEIAKHHIKDAPDILILKEAKVEYAKVR